MQDIDVFISYKREELELAQDVERALVAAGYVVFTDFNIQKSENFSEAIDKKIRESKLVIVLWTYASVKSEWVRKEAEEAARLNKYLGVCIDKVTAEMLPLYVRNSNWLDVSQKTRADGLRNLVGVVRQRVGNVSRAEQDAMAKTKLAERDHEFYQVVDGVGSLSGYQKYIEIYPQGANVFDAEKNIARLSSWLSIVTRVPFWGAIGTLAAIVSAWAAVQTIPRATDENDFLRARIEMLETELLTKQSLAPEENPSESGQGISEKGAAFLSTSLKQAQAALNAERTKLAQAAANIKELEAELQAAKSHALQLQQESATSIKSDCLDSGVPGVAIAGRCIPFGTVQLDLSKSELFGIGPLAGLRDLEFLSLQNTEIENIDAIASNKKLQILNLSKTRIRDLEAVSELELMQKLFLNNTRVTDVTPLASLTALKVLFLSNTQVRDVRALSKLKSLHYISMPDLNTAGNWTEDTEENRKAVQELIATWTPK